MAARSRSLVEERSDETKRSDLVQKYFDTKTIIFEGGLVRNLHNFSVVVHTCLNIPVCAPLLFLEKSFRVWICFLMVSILWRGTALSFLPTFKALGLALGYEINFYAQTSMYQIGVCY